MLCSTLISYLCWKFPDGKEERVSELPCQQNTGIHNQEENNNQDKLVILDYLKHKTEKKVMFEVQDSAKLRLHAKLAT